MIKALFNITFEEVEKFVEYEYKQKAKKSFLFLAIVLGIISIIMFIIKNYFTAVFISVFTLFFILIMCNYVKSNAKGIYQTRMQGLKYCYTFSETGLHIDYATNILAGHCETMYMYLKKVVFYKDCIFIYINDAEAYILPINSFVNAEEYQMACNYLSQAPSVIYPKMS